MLYKKERERNVDICKAAREAVKTGQLISRAAWPDGLWVRPTNTDECCIIGMEGRTPSPRWQPAAEDLIADDWELAQAR